jgi:hypothetical protein
VHDDSRLCIVADHPGEGFVHGTAGEHLLALRLIVGRLRRGIGHRQAEADEANEQGGKNAWKKSRDGEGGAGRANEGGILHNRVKGGANRDEAHQKQDRIRAGRVPTLELKSPCGRLPASR